MLSGLECIEQSSSVKRSLDLQLKITFGDVAYITAESGTSENIGKTVGISLIAHLHYEPKISWGNPIIPRLQMTLKHF